MGFYTDELLDVKRTIGDTEADAFIVEIFSDKEQKSLFLSRLQNLKHNGQISGLKEVYAHLPLFNNMDKLPIWANHPQLEAGTSFFAKHAPIILNMLGLLSLPYCYAAANGSMVLYLSDRMRGDIGKRLIETGEFVWDVMAPNAFDDNGNGFASIAKVRLMHAVVRFYTHQNAKWNNTFGYPVNQEDLAGTNLSFSLIVARGLRKFGFNISYSDQQAFMHLWNVIGWLLGINDDLLPGDGKLAFELEESIRLRQFKPSLQGHELTCSLISYFKSVNKTGQFLNNEVAQVIRYLAGDLVADILGLPATKLSAGKVRLIRTFNFFNDQKPGTNTRVAYQQGLKAFKNNSAALLQV